MLIVLAESKKLTVIDYFVTFFWKVFSVIELMEEVVNWRGWSPTGIHAIVIGYEIIVDDGYVLSVYMIRCSILVIYFSEHLLVIMEIKMMLDLQ